MRKCAERNCAAVLIEENLQGPSLSISDIFVIISEGSKDAAGMPWIAYVDTNNKHNMSLMKFAETASLNRGIKMRLFSTVREAKEWLHTLVGEKKP